MLCDKITHVEISPTAVMYGSAKPEQMASPKPEQSKAVSGVRRAVDKWLERIGPKSIENHFVKAHENVLAALNSDQRKEVFANEAETWRKTGKIIGVTATVVDTALIGAGAGLSFLGWNHLEIGANLYADLMVKVVEILAPLDNPVADMVLEPILGHWLAHLAAGGREQIGKTVETVNRVKRQNAESAQKLKETQQKAAEVKLEKDYQDWIAHHPVKVYYEQSGQPMPSKADYVEMKRQEESAKQAAREEEKRGEAK